MARHGFDPDEPATSLVDFGATRDGIRQLRRQWRADSPQAAVLLVHGIGEHSGRYEHVGRQLVDADFTVVSFDQRGFGETEGVRAYIDHFGQFHDDVQDHLAELRSLDVPVVLMGHSMGGLVALSYCLDDRPLPDLLVLSAPAIGADAPKWMRAFAKPASRLVPRFHLAAPFDSSVLSRDPRLTNDYDNDPLIERATSARLGGELFATMDATRERLGQLSVPTLVLHGGDDTLVPTAATEAMAGVAGVTRTVIAGGRHEIFNEPDGPETIALAIDWIARQLDAGRG